MLNGLWFDLGVFVMLEFKHPKAKTVSQKASIVSFLVVVLALIIYLIFSKPAIEGKTWQLSSAMQQDPYFAVIAHNPTYDFSQEEEGVFVGSHPVDLTCVAENGVLTITDKTNNMVYLGSYERTLLDKLTNGSRRGGRLRTIPIVIDGKEGTAQVSRFAGTWNKTLCIIVDGYILNFDKQ